MKKMKYLMLVVLLLCGCQKPVNNELADYYISLTKSSSDGENVYFQNVAFDFANNETTQSEVMIRNSQYPLIVYDQKYDRYIYSAKYEGDDHIYIYDADTQEEKHLDLGIWGVNYILIRNNDYIVVGVKNETRIFTLYSIDKETFEYKELALPKDIHDDISAWQVVYIPQNNGLIIQAYGENEDSLIMDEWNSMDWTERPSDLVVPYYHYLYTDEKGFEYLFQFDMPQSIGLLSNGKDVLVAANFGHYDKKCVIRYNIESKELTTEDKLKRLNAGIYLDNEGRYIYAIGKKMYKYDTYTGEEHQLDYNFPSKGYNSNYALVRK